MEYVFVEGQDFQKARRVIKENKGKKIIFSGIDDELNRKILEKEKIDVLLINLSKRKDWQKQRDSGFNHVLAKLVKKNSVCLGVNFDEILRANSENKAKILARLRQNIKLCIKNKLKIVFISSEKKDERDLRALGLVLGMPTNMVSNLEMIQCKTKPF